jgi:DNA-binding NarL/FixJ family response regulator
MNEVATVTLTDRQKACVVGIARGLSNTEIAAELDIAERTVKAHIESVRSKLDRVRRREIPYALLQRGIDVYPR